ncbi:MAG: InlB B-repeat-containing protein, partial [Clostridiales Family XIII bacterium]|nr:InlB B-repeat-containing protein [Clostridiales Family XIII bacterium]
MYSQNHAAKSLSGRLALLLSVVLMLTTAFAFPVAAHAEPVPDQTYSVSVLSIAKVEDQVYNGKVKKPKLTVKHGSKVLKINTDYKVTYSKQKKIGKVKIKITGKGNYTGTRTVSFKITANAKVKFDSLGGSAVKTKSVKAKTKVGTLKVPKRTGYTFSGWYTKASGGSKIKTSTKIKDNVTFYAHWKVKKGYAEIKFDANGGSAVPSKVVKKGKAAGTLKTPTKTGFIFKGWYTADNGGSVVTKSTKIKKSITLHARWASKS